MRWRCSTATAWLRGGLAWPFPRGNRCCLCSEAKSRNSKADPSASGCGGPHSEGRDDSVVVVRSGKIDNEEKSRVLRPTLHHGHDHARDCGRADWKSPFSGRGYVWLARWERKEP